VCFGASEATIFSKRGSLRSGSQNGSSVHDKEGKTYSVRYDQVNAMLLNEFLKEHREVQRLKAALDAVNKRLKEQDARIERVSAQVQMNQVKLATGCKEAVKRRLTATEGVVRESLCDGFSRFQCI